MNNTFKALCVFGALAAFAACGDDDGKSDHNNAGDAGGIITVMDSGVKDGGIQGIDAQTPNSGDSGTITNPNTGVDCAHTVKTKQTDFLNGCSASNVMTTTKTLKLLPAQVDPSVGK